MAGQQFPLFVALRAIDNVTGPLAKVQQSIGKVGDAMKRVGSKMTAGLTLPVLGVSAGIIRMAADFDATMRRVGSLTGTLGTPAFKALEDQARELGATTKFTSTQAAEAQKNLALAGFNVNEILEATPGLLELAIVADVDLARAAEIAAGMLRAQGLEASKLSRISDVLAKAQARSKTDVDEFAAGMKFALPTAHGLGQEFEMTAAALMVLSNNMQGGEIGGTGLRGIFNKLVNLTPQMRKQLAELGLEERDLRDETGRLLPLLEVLRRMMAAGFTPEMSGAFFGARPGSAFTTLIGAGIENFEAALKEVREAEGFAAKQAAEVNKGAAAEMAKFRSAMEAAGLAIARSGLLEWFTKLMKGLQGVFAWVEDLSPGLLKLGSFLALLAAAVGPVVLVLGAMTSAISSIIAAAPVVAGVLGAIAAPVGIVVAAIASLVAITALLVKKWDAIRNFFVDLWDAIAGGVMAAVDAIGSAIEWLVDLVPDWLVRLFGGEGGDTFAGFQPRGPDLLPAGAGASGSAGSSETRVRVEFDNVPQGVRVAAESDADLDMRTGIAMGHA